MTVEVWRYVLTAFCATLAPLAIAALRARRFSRAVVSVAVAIAGFAPAVSTMTTWLLILTLPAIQLLLGPRARPIPRGTPLRESLVSLTSTRWRECAVGLALMGGAAAALIAKSGIAGLIWDELTSSDSIVAFVIAALLAVTLAWGVVVETAIALFSARLETIEEGVATEGVRHAGRMIGWLERALIFVGIAVGRPELIAVVVAVKSVARFPELKDETFAEYFLIGTLLSLTGAVLIGGLVRIMVTGAL